MTGAEVGMMEKASSDAQGKVIGGLQTGYGIYQQWKAKKMREKAMDEYNKHPYQIPGSATRSVNLMGRLAQGTGLPGQDIIESNIAGNTAEGVNAIRSSANSPSQVMRGMIQMYQNQQNQQQQLDVAAANDYQRRQGAYAQAVSSLAPYEVEKWKYKHLYPVQAGLNAAEAMSATGQQNMSQGLSSFINSSANSQYSNSLNATAPTAPPNELGQYRIQAPQMQQPQLPANGLFDYRTPMLPMDNSYNYSDFRSY